MRISVSEFSTISWSLFNDVLQLAKRNFEGIGVWRKKIDDIGFDAAVDFLQEMKMPVSSLSWIGGFTGCDGQSFVGAIEDAFEAVELARELAAECLIVHPGSSSGHTRGHARRLIRNALDVIVPYAQDRGVRLALEPMSGPSACQWTFVRDPREALDLISKFDAKDMGLVLDLYHVGDNQKLLKSLPEIADRVALVQVADRGSQPMWNEDNRCLLGGGDLPYKEWVAALYEAGYAGYLEVELHGFEVEQTPYGQLLDHSMTQLSRTLSSLTPAAQRIESRSA